jgi:hypothetical protein
MLAETACLLAAAKEALNFGSLQDLEHPFDLLSRIHLQSGEHVKESFATDKLGIFCSRGFPQALGALLSKAVTFLLILM